MTEYFVYDVFTKAPFGGNPLAVIPDAETLPEDDLQRIAREFNFSETVFLFAPDAPGQTAKVRIFTPTMEIPFAGHPTIGTAVALSDLGHGPDMVLDLGVGPIAARAEHGAAAFTTTAALDILGHPAPDLVARALGLSVQDICTDAHPPTLASLGLPFTLTQLRSDAALRAITTDLAAFRDGAARWPTGLDFAQLAYTRSGNRIEARMFAPLDNIPEDPATGSAAATLAALLAQIDGCDLTLDYSQGRDMGRPSQIDLRTDQGGVTVSGHARRVMQGTLVY